MVAASFDHLSAQPTAQTWRFSSGAEQKDPVDPTSDDMLDQPFKPRWIQFVEA
jgi:hypothetical protein